MSVVLDAKGYIKFDIQTMYFNQEYNFVIRIEGGNLPSSKLKGDSGIESPSLPAAVPHIWVALLLLQSLLAPFATCIFVAPDTVTWHSVGENDVPEEYECSDDPLLMLPPLLQIGEKMTLISSIIFLNVFEFWYISFH